MVIEYTTEERKQLAEINLKYKNLGHYTKCDGFDSRGGRAGGRSEY